MLTLLLSGAVAYLVWRRLLAYLRYFQQEGYDALRFLNWTRLRPITDPALWVSLVCSFLLIRGQSFEPSPRLIALVSFFALGLVLLGRVQPDPRYTGKIPLRLTWRATRVLAAAAAVAAMCWIVVLVLSLDRGVLAVTLACVAIVMLIPIILIVANALLMPYERHVQASYESDAIHRMASVHPFVIGITGSFGKSSTKAMLAHILQFDGPTLAASGSINTLMGVTRHVREELVPGHKFMVVEMGAFKTGSIRRLCQLTPPSAGLITAVGDMHLERFGSLEEIVRAKSELAQALPPGALLAVNADSPGALRIARSATHCRVLLYGETSTENLDTRIEQLAFSKGGSSFVLRTRQGAYGCFTPLLGRPIVLNLAGAVTLAAAIGVDVDLIIASLRTLKPVANRLEVVEENGITWIRDAYNSNQVGFRAALEVASSLPASQRVLATPGVIELGPEQTAVNRALSAEAARVCDKTLIVSETNRAAFVEGHHDAGRDGNLVPVANRTEAFAWLRTHIKSGDLVILENDLPDLYEKTAGLFLHA